jgi:hypothetical protein
MWLLHLLPDALLILIVNLVLFTGIILTLISTFIFDKIGKYVPMFAPYRTAVRVISILILAFGVYFKGGYNTEMIWRERVAELEAQIKVAEEKSKVVNTIIEEKIIYKNTIVKEKAKQIIKYIDRPAITEFDKVCPLPKEVIDIHNEAVEMNLIINNKEPK